MTQFGPMEIGLIAAIVVAALFFILFLVALKSKKKAKETYANQYQTKQEKLTHEHQEELEKVRIDKKKLKHVIKKNTKQWYLLKTEKSMH